jgi:hypothetical protein
VYTFIIAAMSAWTWWRSGKPLKGPGRSGADLDLTLTAPDNEDAEAQYAIGRKFLSSARRVEGMQHLRRAAAQGFAQAQYELGRCLLEQAGSEDEFKEVICLLSSAAENKHGRAAFLLSKIFEEGLGVHKNVDEAQEWAKRSPDSIADKLRYNSQYSQAQDEFVYTKMRRAIRRGVLEMQAESNDTTLH